MEISSMYSALTQFLQDCLPVKQAELVSLCSLVATLPQLDLLIMEINSLRSASKLVKATVGLQR